MTHNGQPRVVIVGAGFGGLWAARALRNAPVEVLLVDRHNYHLFVPLLYQVAAAELEPEEIAYLVRRLLWQISNTQFVLSEVTAIDLAARRVQTSAGPLSCDFLILGLGSTSHFFGVAGAAEHAFSLKTLEQGVALRNHILERFEDAVYEPEVERRRRALTFVVVGGGATGVEFAGALAELIHGPLVRDYPTLDFHEVRVVLLEAGDQLLPTLPERLQDYAQPRLAELGVEIRLRAAASQITAQAVRLKDSTVIPTETVVWTAGVGGDSLAGAWGLPTAPNGQVMVLPTLQVPDHPEVNVIGDLARIVWDQPLLPMTAPVAIQQGVTATRNVARQVAKQKPKPFQYRDQGTMVTIGRNAAVADLGGRTFTGFLVWVIGLGVHLFNLIGFRNRLFVLLDWAWDYFFYDRAVRLILPGAERGPASGTPAAPLYELHQVGDVAANRTAAKSELISLNQGPAHGLGTPLVLDLAYVQLPQWTFPIPISSGFREEHRNDACAVPQLERKGRVLNHRTSAAGTSRKREDQSPHSWTGARPEDPAAL